MSVIRIATRNSPLALWQANFVKQELQRLHHKLDVKIVGMTTQGDQLLDRSLAKAGGKGLFLKELEMSLLNNDTDIAVHSMKDVPAALPIGLEIATLFAREDPRDAFVSNEYQNLYALPKGAKVGTSSLRRTAQLRSAFPNLEFIGLRGNVNTRLAKLDEGLFDGIILAAAGLIRLEFTDRIKQYISPELCLPAVGQGVVGIECRTDDERVKALLKPLHNRQSSLQMAAERAMNARLEGGCQMPVAGFAELSKGKITLRGLVATVDGAKLLKSRQTSRELTEQSAALVGEQIADDLLKQGAAEIIRSVRDEIVAAPQKSLTPVVVLTRQQQFLGNMANILESLDYQPVVIQTMDIEPVYDAALLKTLKNLQDYTDIVFVSRNAVEVGMALIKQQQLDIPVSCRVMAVGAETAKQLYKYGVDSLFPDHRDGMEALLSVGQLADLSGRNILMIRGTGGLTWPAVEMRKRGARVEMADVYKDSIPGNLQQNFQALYDKHARIAGVFLHSVNSTKNFIAVMRENEDQYSQTVLIAGSRRIADAAKSFGWQNEVRVAQSPSNKHMMICFSG